MMHIPSGVARILSTGLNWMALTLLVIPAVFSAQETLDERNRIIVVGSGNPEDGCSIAVPASVYPEMVEIGLLDWNTKCESEGWGDRQ